LPNWAFLPQAVKGERSPNPRILRLLVEEEKNPPQQVFRERHRLHPAGILEMGKVGGEVEVRLKSPAVEGLKFV
jgi:hypothetical protein